MMTNTPSIRKAFNFASPLFKENFGLFASIMLTFFMAWVILEVLVVNGQPLGLIFWAITHLIFFVIFAGMQVGFMQLCLDLYDGKQVRYADIFSKLNLSINFLFVQLVYLVMVLVGLVLLIVPGAYLGTKYTFYAFTFAEGNPNLKQSFQESAVLSEKSMGFLFWFSMLMLLFNILGASVLGIGLIITLPISLLMKAYIYRHLQS